MLQALKVATKKDDAEIEPEKVIEPIAEHNTEAVLMQIPFPSWLEDKHKRDKVEFVSFLNLVKLLNVNFPLIELTEKIPKYAKCLKEITTTHRKIKKGNHINLDLTNIRYNQKKALKDVLVKVHNFIILVDFVILDFEEDSEIPILLERPSLTTIRSTIDLENN
ncbi:hypothetical protein EPI10_001529 [Gossypium australe]|uniref:Uncharacterized protein n=1 Tax=Gossypium australe TaxID=47621 RepID=A0A5B6VBR7_9ROSI|nr:hypothetical protein EPI10_001529 [Gossypium australe]